MHYQTYKRGGGEYAWLIALYNNMYYVILCLLRRAGVDDNNAAAFRKSSLRDFC
jgi:hypothetical protein